LEKDKVAAGRAGTRKEERSLLVESPVQEVLTSWIGAVGGQRNDSIYLEENKNIEKLLFCIGVN
jgi:hypothetical protein